MCIERNVVIFVAILLVVIFVFMVYNKRTENFDVNVVPKPVMMPVKTMAEADGEHMKQPHIGVEVGNIVDGPGFESGEVDGVDQKAILGTIPADYYFLDDGGDGKYSITSNLFSKSCCSAQWPVPFHQKYDPYVCNNKDQYVGSNIMGNNTFQDAGCACLNSDQAKFLYNRGGNGREFF